MSKDLVPFTNEKPLTPGKGGGLKFWRLQREKQQLRDEITDMALVMRRLSQELIEQLLFLKDPDRNIPEVVQRRMSQIVGALKRESGVLTSLFAIGDLHPALQRIFLEKRTPDAVELPAIDLKALEAPATLPPPVEPTLLHLLSNREIEILTYALAGHSTRNTASKLGIKRVSVNSAIHHIHKKAQELVGKGNTDGKNISPMD